MLISGFKSQAYAFVKAYVEADGSVFFADAEEVA